MQAAPHTRCSGVLPLAEQRSIAAIGTKPFCGNADAVKTGLVKPAEMLRTAVSRNSAHAQRSYGWIARPVTGAPSPSLPMAVTLPVARSTA